MPIASIGPGGYQVSGSPCSNNTFLSDQNNPLGALRDTLYVQRLTGVDEIDYTSLSETADAHQPMRASTASRVDNVTDYKIGVHHEGYLNGVGVTDVTPSASPYTDTRQLLTQCQDLRTKGIGASTNGNAEACNPLIDGPVPVLGSEAYGRKGYVLRMPFPPLCMASYANKEGFHVGLTKVMNKVTNSAVEAWAANKIRWQVQKTRYNIVPVQQPTGDGKARLPSDSNLITPFTFGRVPEHYGSFEWIARMLLHTEIPRRKNVTIELPAVVFERYKLDQFGLLNANVFEQASNISRAINGYDVTILQDSINYTDRVTGRILKFKATRDPVYVEVQATGPNIGEWQFQEPTIARDSESPNQIMPRENPVYGVACSCPGKVLAAIITVSADGADKPFAQEPFPVNPDTGLRALFDSYSRGRGREINTTLNEMYPTSIETRIFTGLEAQKYILDPLNTRYRAAGWDCDVANNIEDTWVGGYVKIAGVWVEVDPRKHAKFLIRIPTVDTCVDVFAPCADFDPVSAPGEIEPLIQAVPKQVLPIPDPVPAPTPPAGTIFVVGNGKMVKAPCAGSENKSVSVKLVRRGGTAGSITINVAAEETTHSGTIPSTVVFADGVETAYLTWDILPWSCADETATEKFDITFSGAALDEDTTDEYPVCIQCTKDCVDDCGFGEGACSTC